MQYKPFYCVIKKKFSQLHNLKKFVAKLQHFIIGFKYKNMKIGLNRIKC